MYMKTKKDTFKIIGKVDAINQGLNFSNISVIDENKQVEDLFACIPKAGYLIILKNL